ncbi:MAG TPA: PKD domain-containing protein [Chitinophagales bacterium]|nr:PKD domain-containing protein [Chitinophagales bacterium]
MRYFILFLFAVLTLPSMATVHADFGADRWNGCPPLLSTFTNTSTNTSVVPGDTLKYRWDFSNGNGSGSLNPSAIFQNSGTYRVRLIATTAITNISDTVTKSVVVFRVPQANFQAPTTTICFGDTFFLNSNVTLGDAPITDYAWGFGNGVASSITNPFYVYTQTGLYDVTLVIQDSNHCSVSLIRPQYVNVVPKPVASFTANPATTCAQSQLVSFTNLSTGNNLSYFWQLTNTVTSTAANPTHTYVNETYLASLKVTDVYGCTSTASQAITVSDLSADFLANKTEVCTGEQIYFYNHSNFSGTSAWDFGDGYTSNATSPYYSYTQPGTYTVKLTQSFGNCTDVVEKVAYIYVKQGFIPSFTMSGEPTECNEPAVVDFVNTTNVPGANVVWNFGDGSATSTEQNVTHTYSGNGNYTVTLTVTDPNGCVSKTTSVVPVSTYVPVPSFYCDTLVCRGGTIKFTNTSTNPYLLSNGTFSWLWTFGDGDSSTQASPTHIYQQAGVYSVTLRITNSLGCDTFITVPNLVRVDVVDVDFVVNETFSPCPPFVALFASTCNKNNVVYEWSFGDNQTDTAADPTHIYFYPGIFDVSLVVTTPNGCTDTALYPHLIEVQGPYGVFAATPTSGCAPLTVSFMASISDNTRNMWCDLGDGSLVTDSLQFNYTYTTLGNFNPKFILVDHVGCTVPYSLPVIRTHAPSPLNLKDTAVCAGALVNIPTLGTDSYQWVASPDITCDTCSSLSITPSKSGDYIVKATNQYCTVADTMHVFVDTIPVLNPSTFNVCSNSEIELYVGDAYAISWSPALYLSDSAIARPVCKPQDSILYIVTAYNSLGCTATALVDVVALDKLKIEAIGDITACAFDSFQLSTSVVHGPDAAIAYSWSPAGNLDATDIANPVGRNLISSTTFQVIASSGTCAADTATVMVNVNNLPDLQVSEPVTTSPYAEVKLWASSMQDLTYAWTAKDSLSCAGCRITSLYPGQTQMVQVTGTNEFGCKTTDSVQIRVMACDPESVFLPNIFTPNGDGLNDEFFVSSKVLSSINYFRIFDEWGSLLFETKNINDAWDGKVNGQSASTDVFVYLLQGTCQNGGEVTKYGNITLVR